MKTIRKNGKTINVPLRCVYLINMKKAQIKGPVSADMNISDVVRDHPKVAEVFTEYGLHCIGCAISEFETIEQGAMGHGMDRETIDNLVGEINLAITKKPDYPLNKMGITISPRAVKMIKSLMKEDKETAKGLQIQAEKKEGELEYFLDLVKSPKEGEDTLEWKGVKIFIDEYSLKLMKPSVIDFVNTPAGEGFKVINLH